jgi:rhodanese-related sulfurtransferase
VKLSYKRYGLVQRTIELTAIGAALVAIGSPALAQTAPKAPAAAAATAPDPTTLKRAQIDALLATPSKVVFLDVRRADEVSDIGGFPVFLNIQLADLDKYLAYIPKDRTIVAVSNHAHRAVKAEDLLKKNGFKVAGVVGVLDYADEGGVLVGKKPPAKVAAGAPAAQGQ